MVRRIGSAALVLTLAGSAAVMSPAAVTFPGSIKITSPVRMTATGGDVDITWTYRTGSAVKSTSKVNIAVTQNGYAWYTIGSGLPIRGATFTWPTSEWADGVWAIRAVVVGTTVKSVVSPLTIDNTAPEVRITRPSEGEVLVENQRVVFFAAVVGKATLQADARDALSGIKTVRWYLNEQLIGEGASLDHNFSTQPGRHWLRAEAVDAAGNTADHEIVVLAAPGPSAAENAAPPESLPVPDASGPPATDDAATAVPALPQVTLPDAPALPIP